MERKAMKRLRLSLSLPLAFFMAMSLHAQTQHGYVKTKGRLGSNGQVIAGVRLTGTTVRLKGQNVVSQASGTFSFVVSNKKYTVLDIQKKNYLLYDREQLKEYAYSSNPLILVLEKPDERESDKLMAQQKISRTLRRQLQQREDELEQLKEENKITQQEYHRLYNELYSDDKKNQHLIESMAERYASMDFEQMDEENRKIKTFILNGELLKADSIINAKGSLEDRIASFKAHKEANKQEEQELSEREERLQKSKAVENLTLNEIAEDCLNKHEMYKLRCMFDSAAYYIQTRAELDTMNWEWQFETASYYQDQNAFALSEKYYVRSMNILNELVKGTPHIYEKYLSQSYNSLAGIYTDTQRFEESEKMYRSALSIINENLYDSLSIEKLLSVQTDLANLYNNLGVLYSKTQRFKESEWYYKSAIDIFESLAKDTPQTYGPDLATLYNNLAALYFDTQRVEESEEMYKIALAIYKRLTKVNPQAYEPDLAYLTNNLAALFYKTERFEESEKMYKSALAIRERLAKDNPQAYEPNLATSYNDLAVLYSNTQRFEESEKMYKSALAISERLAKDYPQAYEPNLASLYSNFAALYFKTQRFEESENMYKLAFDIYERLDKTNPQKYREAKRGTLVNLSYVSIFTKRFKNAEFYSFEAIKMDFTIIFDDKNGAADKNLASSRLLQGEYEDAEEIYRQYKDILKEEFLVDFDKFEKAGIIPEERKKDVERIKAMLNEP